jgi:fumarate reductase flavoprotein subunit
MSRTISADVAVVGAGFAGVAAALRARELGANVILLEKTGAAPSWSNSRMAGGRYHVAMLDPDASPELIERRVLDSTGGCASEETVHALAVESARAFEWTRRHGARYTRVGRGVIMAPLRPNQRGNVWRGRGPDRTLRTLFAAYLRAGGRYEGRTRVTELQVGKRGVSGLIAEATDGRLEVRNSAVILADGGFQGDPLLLERYAHVSNMSAVLQRGAATGCGDGLRMAIAAGARIVNTEALYGHLVHADATTNQELSPYPMLDALAMGSIVVSPDGSRFYDESAGGIHAINQIVRAPWNGSPWLIFDHRSWMTSGLVDQIVPANPNLIRAGARIFTGVTPADLAQQIGLPPSAVSRTVEEFNSAMRGGSGATLRVRRSKPSHALEGSLYAVPLLAGITFTMGGPLIDGAARVLTDGGRPIPGLHAAGTAAGGVAGGPKPGYAGGISVALTFGLIAGESATAQVMRTA